ncbi:hypothetical protein DOY81_015246, partial [Sarcophaga bullata]
MLQPAKLKFTNPLYGQLIVGPPGSELGRSVAICNLDPANENMDNTAAIDVMELITVQDVELYTHHAAMSKISKLEKEGYHLVTINLIDSHYCSEPAKFVSTLLLALNMMLRMGLPHVNVLSKADLLKKHEDKLQFNLDFYTDVLDLKYLLEALDDTPSLRKYKKLNAAICSMVEDYSLVSFQLLD